MQRKLWIDTRGEPVITTAPNGERNARRWGWVEAEAIPESEVIALRDYLLNELGLWRDPETGLIVVTKPNEKGFRLVVDADSPGRTAWRAGGGVADDARGQAVARWRATLTPPPREPKPGEVWRLTFPEGQERNALVSCVDGMTAFRWGGDWHPVDEWPADRRRLLVEADGTVVAGDE